MLAGHNVGFDVARLHLELGRIDLELADLPLLDALGLVDPTHHDAASDAAATAQAVVALLEHAAHAGEDDLDALLRRDDTDDGEPLPDDHTASHADLLPAKPTSKTLAAWRDALADCVALRCPYLPDRIDTAEAPGRLLLDELESALDTALTDGDAAGAATLLEAAGGLYRELDGRRPALAWYDRRAPRIATVGRCTDEDDRCPACRNGRPCPADVWHHDLAPVALGRPDLAKTFLPPAGERAGAGVFATWRRDGRHRLADYTAWLAWNYWRQVAIRRGQLAGRQAHLTARIAGTDADGNPVHARRHHPVAPRRRRPHRFKLR